MAIMCYLVHQFQDSRNTFPRAEFDSESNLIQADVQDPVLGKLSRNLGSWTLGARPRALGEIP